MSCEPGGCSSEGVCVRFKPDEPRLSSSWCMLKCSHSCDRDAYVCRSAAELNAASDTTGEEMGKRFAEVLDSNTNQKFCVVKE